MKGAFRMSRFVELNHGKYHWLAALGTRRTIDFLWNDRDATPSGGSAAGLSTTGASGGLTFCVACFALPFALAVPLSLTVHRSQIENSHWRGDLIVNDLTAQRWNSGGAFGLLRRETAG